MIYYIYVSQTSEASDSCDVSKTTFENVDNCPDSEEKFREAAARKNCAAYSNRCSEPDKLEYHCVLDPYVTQKLEVCAYKQNILGGKSNL